MSMSVFGGYSFFGVVFYREPNRKSEIHSGGAHFKTTPGTRAGGGCEATGTVVAPTLCSVLKANRRFYLLVFPFWFIFGHGPKRLSFQFWVLWAIEFGIAVIWEAILVAVIWEAILVFGWHGIPNNLLRVSTLWG